MDTIRGLFGTNPQRGQLPRVDNDHVYLTSLLDDTHLFRDLILTWTFCFNDVLNPEKLHSSLTSLLKIGDWKKFGGRLRLNENDRLEIHVPREFTSERPAVRYTHETLDMSINNHPLGKKMPKVTEKPSIQPGAQEFEEFVVTKDDPVNGSDLFEGDKPQMSLRIVSFSDATLVSLV
ncbi:hypothetical protein CEP54_012781 [Fusarium duplospermum]|uniref:Uncharacterized protein n=1 Tax=Fusarium duplospermum TaxID=1325734 RepID=A0A428P6L0_9HYPO|nr:hypothetical protein CEP54_012781 [Fusarium duplospermum]